MSISIRVLSLVLLFIVPITGYAQYQSTITGHVLGSDGKPMLMAHVSLAGGLGNFDWQKAENEDILHVQVAPDGSFILPTDSLGAFYIAFTGVGHKTMQIPLIIEKPSDFNIEARLENLKLGNDFKDAEVRYDFDEVGRGKIAVLKNISRRVFVAEVPYKKKEFKYRLFRIGDSPSGVSIPEATADSYEFTLEETYTYTSIIHNSKDTVRIVVDDTKPRLTRTPECISFSDSQCVQARFFRIHKRFEDSKPLYDKALRDHMLAGKSFGSFVYNWKRIADGIKKDYAGEREPCIRQELIMQYLELSRFSFKNFDSSFVRRNIKDIPPTSIVWIYHGTTALNSSSFHNRGKKYVQQILDKHPSRSFRAMLLYHLCANAMMEKRKDEYTRLFNKLTTEYSDTRFVQTVVVSSLKSGEKVRIGKTIPNFMFHSIDNDSITYTNDVFKGTYVLIDFWSTWCIGCIEEIPFIQKAYDKFRDKNLNILSVSYDKSTNHVKYFRSTKYKMPWLNAWVENKDQPRVSRIFGDAYPRPILVGPQGTILAMDQSLRGKQLEKTLSKYLESGK